jgi:hypothetical protein
MSNDNPTDNPNIKKKAAPRSAYREGGKGNNPTNNVWKDEKGRWLTLSLFYELAAYNDKSRAIYTKYEVDVERDGKIYKSLKDIYVNYDHIPGNEYDFANQYFGGWDHWKALQSSAQAVKDLIQSWRDELEVRIKSESVKGIIASSKGSDNTAFQAQKWLSDKGWIPQKGRPKKADIQREAKIAAQVEKEIEADIARIRLVK